MGLVIFTFGVVPVFLLAMFTYYPFVKMVQYSFFKMSYTKVRGFVGLDNYRDIFSKPELLATFRISLYYMAGAIMQIVLALYLPRCSLQNRRQGLLQGRDVLSLPHQRHRHRLYFQVLYTRGYVLDSVLGLFGIPLDSLPYWLRDQSINNWSLVGTSCGNTWAEHGALFRRDHERRSKFVRSRRHRRCE
jgi:multiple sugar transport system permease protein